MPYTKVSKGGQAAHGFDHGAFDEATFDDLSTDAWTKTAKPARAVAIYGFDRATFDDSGGNSVFDSTASVLADPWIKQALPSA